MLISGSEPRPSCQHYIRAFNKHFVVLPLWGLLGGTQAEYGISRACPREWQGEADSGSIPWLALGQGQEPYLWNYRVYKYKGLSGSSVQAFKVVSSPVFIPMNPCFRLMC